MPLKITSSGSTQRTQAFLDRMSRPSSITSQLDAIARRGVEALRAATPVESGATAAAWSYEIEVTNATTSIHWINTNENNGANVAILLQYGHGTGTGGYVAGRDYINPAMKPIFDQIADDVWKKVTAP